MDCPKCNLRYNATKRKPNVLQCGHTLCQMCCNLITECPICQILVDKQKLKMNHSLMQMIEEKKILKDIDKFIKVCFVGESKVGKTSLINRLRGNEYKEDTVATIGYDFAFVDRVINDFNIRFQLWDSAGQERYRAVSPIHYKNSDIVVIVYDVTQDSKSNNVWSWYEQALKHCPENVIKIFIGNKIDLYDQIDVNNIKPLDECTWKVIASEQINNYQVSCKNYEGIEQFWSILEQNVRIILKRIIHSQNPLQDTGNVIKKPKRKNSKKKKLYQIKQEMRMPNDTCIC